MHRRRYMRLGDLRHGQYFRLSSEDREWFRVRWQIEDYTEVQMVFLGGKLGKPCLFLATTEVVPLGHTTEDREVDMQDSRSFVARNDEAAFRELFLTATGKVASAETVNGFNNCPLTVRDFRIRLLAAAVRRDQQKKLEVTE